MPTSNDWSLSADSYEQNMNNAQNAMGFNWVPFAGQSTSALADQYMNHANNIFNAAEAQKQRDWEFEMSSTAYQRAVEDMKKAGLNPASLSAGSVSPASGGSGSSASSSGGSYKSSKSDLGALASFFAAIAKLVAS